MTATPVSRRPDPFVWAALLLVGGLLATLSIMRYLAFTTGMLDLGNMSQAIWSATQGQPLIFSDPNVFQVSRLAWHVEVIYFLLAIPYALWPDPRLLLILQAALFVLGALPAYHLALRRTGKVFAARCIALIYLLYPVAQTGVLFDVHGDTLAMPLLMFALNALDRRAWGWYALWIALTLSCKFYVAVTVAGLGVVLYMWEGQRRAGALTIAAGVGYLLLAVLVIRPLFAPAIFGADSAGSATFQTYLNHYFGRFEQVLETLPQRLLTLVVVFGPVLLVAWRGWRWLLPIVPIVGVLFLSSGPGGISDYRYHHYTTTVPFFVMATIAGVQQMQQQRTRRSWRGDLGLTTAIVGLCTVLLVDTPLNPMFWLGVPGMGLDSAQYGITARDREKPAFLAQYVPPHEPMAVSTFLAAHIANRETLYLVRYPDEPRAERLPQVLPRVKYVLADGLFDFFLPLGDNVTAGGIAYDLDAIRQMLAAPDFGLTVAYDGLLLFEREAPRERVLQQQIAPTTGTGGQFLADFGDAIRLHAYDVEQLPDRLRLSVTWEALRPLDETRLVAVSILTPTTRTGTRCACCTCPAMRCCHPNSGNRGNRCVRRLK
ncbi:MAG: DUF2079 domain-containing protein [Chloroflexaceae bacterium]|nr:DUF2079 domain-containing protein [Chloroflexaceae bacterium]